MIAELLKSNQFSEEFKRTIEGKGFETRQPSRWILTYQPINDRCISSCVEGLIGAYLVECGRKGAGLFMQWIGFDVLPQNDKRQKTTPSQCYENRFAYKSTRLNYNPFRVDFDPSQFIQRLLPSISQKDDIYNLYEQKQYSNFEKTIGYAFKNRYVLLQAFTHESFSRKWCYEK